MDFGSLTYSRNNKENGQMNSTLKPAEESVVDLLVKELLQEHERAINQRDTFILTGKSTASHGGSHDTCFKHIVEKHLLNAYKAGMTDAAQVVAKRANDYDDEHGHTDMETGTREYPKNGDYYMLELTEIQEVIISARDRKESL